MCASVDPPFFLVLNKNPADVRRRSRNTLESAPSPNPRKLAFAFMFLSNTPHFSVRKVFAFMCSHNAESSMPFLVGLTNPENRLAIYFSCFTMLRA